MSEPTSASPRSIGKRRRVDEAQQGSNSASTDIIRSPDVWFDDGNVILQAENTQFRIHKGYISSQSTIISDILQPVHWPPEETYVDRCPIIQFPETAKEWSDLLMALYNAFKLIQVCRSYTIDRLLSLLRLGHKYKIEHLFTMAVERVKVWFPYLREYNNICLSMQFHETLTKDYEFDVINVALEVGINTILPNVYFSCLTKYSIEDITGGYRRPQDGTTTKLSPATQLMLLTAKESLTDLAIQHIVLAPLHQLQRSYGEGTVVCDLIAGMRCAERNMNPDRQFMRSGLNLKELVAELSTDSRLGEMCRACKKVVSTEMDKGREKIWDALPMAFGLPPYPEIQDLDI